MEVVKEAMGTYYGHVENESVPWDDEEQCYLGENFSTSVLVRERHPPSERNDVLKAIISRLGDHLWCKCNFASLRGAEQYRLSWNEFCETVKHSVRYLFLTKTPENFEEGIPVAYMLDHIADLIVSRGLVRGIPVGTIYVRVRVHPLDDVCSTRASLGPPPPDKAKTSRMSPAGISLFYAATDVETALAETTPSPGEKQTSAEWTTAIPLNILDLTNIPPVPDFYEANEYFARQDLLFLHGFAEDVGKSVVPDGREHIEYVPTQIFAEYLRLRFMIAEAKHLDGILYPSAKRPGGTCVVLFYGWDYFERERWLSHTPPIELVPNSVR
jgi:hypothetical protein